MHSPMEIEYEIDQNDLAAAHLFAQKQSKVYVPMAYFRIAVILIYCTWAWSFRPTSLETALEGVVFVLVSIGAVGVVLRTLNVPLERHHFIWSFKHRPELQQRCGRKTAIVAPDGLTFASDISANRIYWSAIDRVETVGDLIFVTVGKYSHYFVPRRAFADEAASKQFMALIEENRRAVVT